MRALSTLWRRFRRRRHGFEEFYGDLDAGTLERQFKEALGEGKSVSPSLLLTAATLRLPQCRVTPAKRALGHEYYEPLLRKWRDSNKGDLISAIAPHAVALLRRDDPDLRVMLAPAGAPDFDWSPARIMVNRTDQIAEEAKVWIADKQARYPHLERAYAISTQILAAVQRERWRRAAAGMASSAPPSSAFRGELQAIEPQLSRAEQLFVTSATQNAHSLYLRGMFWGAVGVALFSAAGGGLLYAFDLGAVIGVAFPAGALGAVISVLQRLTSGSLDIDFHAPASRLKIFGAARPWIGAVFGTVLYALLKSELLGVSVNAPPAVGPELAFFGVIGFLAGFNERFAQDVVTGSSAQLRSALGAT